MGHSHLSAEGRATLQRCLEMGISLRKIGKILGCSAAALCKERKRNSVDGKYEAQLAQSKAYNRRVRCARRKKKLPDALVAYIFEKMQLYWSPEQIEGRLKIDYPDDRTEVVPMGLDRF